jgi:hypothetical protein
VRFESWLAPLIPGLLLAALGSWGTWQLLEDRRLVELAGRSPEQQDIAEAHREKVVPRLPLEDPSEHPVVLTDLVVDCSLLAPIDGHVYAASVEVPRQPRVLVEILPGQSCREAATHAFVLEPASEDLETAFELGRYEQAMVARGLRSDTGSLLWALGPLGLGAFFIVVALRTRRQLAAELAQALAVAGRPRRRAPRDAASHEGAPYRANEAVAPLLPRPLALRASSIAHARRTGLGLGVFGAACLVITLGYVTPAGWAQRAEQQRWSEGVPAVDVGYSANLRSRFLGSFQWLDAVYVYRTIDGEPHVAEQSIHASFGTFDRDSFAVRYDPADPSRHASSWVEQEAGAIWAWIAIMGAFGLFASLSSLALARRALANPRCWATVLEHPEEVVLEVRSVGAMKYELTVPGQPQPLELLVPDPREEPLFLDRDRTRVLALRNPKQPGAIMVVRCDLAPLDLDPGIAEEIRERMRK